jgi:hypothetical protein
MKGEIALYNNNDRRLEDWIIEQRGYGAGLIYRRPVEMDRWLTILPLMHAFESFELSVQYNIQSCTKTGR